MKSIRWNPVNILLYSICFLLHCILSTLPVMQPERIRVCVHCISADLSKEDSWFHCRQILENPVMLSDISWCSLNQLWSYPRLVCSFTCSDTGYTLPGFCRWSDILCWSMLISLIHWFVQLSFQSTVQSFVQCSNICSIILSLFSSITCSTTLSVTCLNHLWSTCGHIFISLHIPTHTCSFSCSGTNFPLPVICYILLYNTLSLVDLIHLFSRLFSQRFSRIFNHSWHLFSYVNNDLSNHVVIVSWITCSSILPVTCLNHLWSCHIPTLTCSFSCFGIGHTLPVIHYTLLIYVELCWSHLFVQPFFRSMVLSLVQSFQSLLALIQLC